MSAAWQVATASYALAPTAGVPLLRILGGAPGQVLSTLGEVTGELYWGAGGGEGGGGLVLVDGVSIIGNGVTTPLSVAVADEGVI